MSLQAEIRKDKADMTDKNIQDELTNSVKNFYNFLPFPGRLVHTFNLPKGWRKSLKLWVAKNTLFHRSNVKRIETQYRNIIKNPAKFFDAACGTGELACLLAMAFPNANVEACDLSSINLTYAHQLKSYLKISNVQFFQYDLTSDEPLDSNDNDLVICSGAIHHLLDPVKGLRKLAGIIKQEGRIIFGVYGKAFFREEYLANTLRNLLSNFNYEEKLKFLRDFNIRREDFIRDIKRENKLLKHLSILKGDLSYLGYELFPHNENSLQMDGFCHPNVKYYDPDSLFRDIETAGLEIEKFQNFKYPKIWLEKPFFKSLSLKEKFCLIDAYALVPYVPICKLKKS